RRWLEWLTTVGLAWRKLVWLVWPGRVLRASAQSGPAWWGPAPPERAPLERAPPAPERQRSERARLPGVIRQASAASNTSGDDPAVQRHGGPAGGRMECGVAARYFQSHVAACSHGEIGRVRQQALISRTFGQAFSS